MMLRWIDSLRDDAFVGCAKSGRRFSPVRGYDHQQVRCLQLVRDGRRRAAPWLDRVAHRREMRRLSCRRPTRRTGSTDSRCHVRDQEIDNLKIAQRA